MSPYSIFPVINFAQWIDKGFLQKQSFIEKICSQVANRLIELMFK